MTPPNDAAGRITGHCRRICSLLLAAPLLYWWTLGYAGDALLLLILAAGSLLAGVVLLANSLYCLFRYRRPEQLARSFFFLCLSVGGVIAMGYVLPGWKM